MRQAFSIGDRQSAQHRQSCRRSRHQRYWRLVSQGNLKRAGDPSLRIVSQGILAESYAYSYAAKLQVSLFSRKVALLRILWGVLLLTRSEAAKTRLKSLLTTSSDTSILRDRFGLPCQTLPHLALLWHPSGQLMGQRQFLPHPAPTFHSLPSARRATRWPQPSWLHRYAYTRSRSAVDRNASPASERSLSARWTDPAL